MDSFFIALFTVGVMLLYACPGYLMVKTGLIKSAAIADFAKLLMYVCQPALTVYSFMQVEFSVPMLGDMLFVFFFVLLLFAAVLLFFRFFFFKKKAHDVRVRIYTLAICFSNCAFMGVPVLEALLPHYPQAVALSAMFALAMNVLGWTLASAIITNDRKYMSVKKIVLNPAVLSLAVAVPLFVSGVSLPSQIDGMVTLLARMTTPLCMLIMGMRLATARIYAVFSSFSQYAVAAAKAFAMPLLSLALLLLFPIGADMRAAVYIMMACPSASVVLNFAEMLGEGQETAANLVLLSTLFSALTIPVMVLLI
jgi:predicted permease